MGKGGYFLCTIGFLECGPEPVIPVSRRKRLRQQADLMDLAAKVRDGVR
jgi:hypothetical protein